MSLVKSTRISRLCLQNRGVLYTAVRNHFNKDYMPGAFPKTQAEREAAAQKFGLDLSEYKTYPDNGSGLGDYPKLPDVSGEARDPYYPWDNPELKRNFNEPMHIDVDLMGEDRYDVSARHRQSHLAYIGQFLSVMLGTFGLMYALENCRMFPGTVPKQYPKPGVKHYTFEKCE